MLKLAADFSDDLKQICSLDVFGTRILGYFQTYSDKFDFCTVWIQHDDSGKPSAAVSRVNGDITVCAGENADYDELSAFVSMSDYASLQCQKSVMNKLGLIPDTNGYVLRFNPGEYSDRDISQAANFKEIYDIIKGAGLMGVGDYLPWLSDVTYRVNHGTALTAVITEDGGTVSCAMALFITDEAALLGAVATKNDYRGRGYAGSLVKYLGNKMTKQNKKTYLLCKQGSIFDFYKSIGFEKEDEWSAITPEEK